MQTVTKQYRAEIAHRLPKHHGKCRFVHGHSYLFEVTAYRLGAQNKESGMVVDFSILKEMMEQVISPWDHTLILYEKDDLVQLLPKEHIKLITLSFIPTAENMALYIAGELNRILNPLFVGICNVKVWETATSFAEWKSSVC